MVKYYGKLNLSKDKAHWVIDAEPHVNMRLKDLFRQINKHRTSGLVLSNNPQNCKDLEWFTLRYPLEMSEDDAKALESGRSDYDTRQERLEQILLPDYKPTQIDLAKPARNYQSVAVDLWMSCRRLLCGDSVGLGKTIIGIAGLVAAARDGMPAMVVCQTHLPTQWKQKFQEFAPKVRVHIVKSRRPYNLPEADVYLFSYSKIIGWNDLIKTGFFKATVFDECQELRIPGSSKYQSCQLASNLANYSLGLSATPVYNYGDEIFSVVDLIKKAALGTRTEFLREWTGDEYGYRIKNPVALNAYLLENHLMIRRTAADVSRELPPVNKIIHTVEYNESTAKKHEKDLKEIAARVLEGSFVERGMAARQLDSMARMITGVAKAHGVADYVKLLLENGEKVLLAGWHRSVYDIWLKELKEYNPVMYTGSETPIQKNKSKEAFVNGESQLMIISLRSGVGLDGLQSVCNTVIIGELDWSPAVIEQLIGRVRRDGQESQVTAIYLMSNNGTDPLMVDLLGLKASQADGIMNGNKGVMQTVTDDERIKKLAKNILEKKN